MLKPNPNAINTNIKLNPNPNPNNPNHNHTPRMENSLEQIWLSLPGVRKYHLWAMQHS